MPCLAIYPRTFYATPRSVLERAIGDIKVELEERLAELNAENKKLEAQRLHQRTMFDIEMIQELGYCNGIENYSRHLSRRRPGEPPPTLIDYFPSDFLLVVDESHVSIPQVRGMYFGDQSKAHARRLRVPAAWRSTTGRAFEEFRQRIGQTVHVSATPAAYELELAGGEIVEQLDPSDQPHRSVIEIRPSRARWTTCWASCAILTLP